MVFYFGDVFEGGDFGDFYEIVVVFLVVFDGFEKGVEIGLMEFGVGEGVVEYVDFLLDDVFVFIEGGYVVLGVEVLFFVFDGFYFGVFFVGLVVEEEDG